MLFDPEAFEPLTDEPWDEPRVRRRIQSIVDDADAALDDVGDWDVFGGVAGVVLALDALRRRVDAEVRTDLPSAIERTLARAVADPERESSLLDGESGILLVAWSLTRDESIAERLLVCVRANMSSNANELMWGIPGTMLAARAMYRSTHEQRWLDAWLGAAEELRSRRDADGLWTQHLSGHEVRYLGPVHGAVGNTLVLLDGDPDEDVSSLVATLEHEAVVEGKLANWPPAAGGPFVGRDGQIRVQWCHGAPGIVTSTISFLPLELVLAGAELVWEAGPHDARKGFGLCHGTAGNGYALLKTFERTGDELWLERARRFAVHALSQVERADAPRHSLFGGDVGVALFAADCIDGKARFPVLDGFDALQA